MHDDDRLLRRTEVERRYGLARSTIYRLMRDNRFPLPIRVGPRAVRWSLAELDAWVAAQPRASGEDPLGPKRTPRATPALKSTDSRSHSDR